jgi:hypothetical protein
MLNLLIQRGRLVLVIAILSVLQFGCSKSDQMQQGITKIVIDSAKSEKATFAGTKFGPNGISRNI